MPYSDPEKRRARWHENREKNVAYLRAQYAKHREKRLAAKSAEWHANQEENRAKQRAKYASNRAANVERAREYRRQKRDEVNAKAMERYYVNRAAINDRRKALRQRPEAKAKAYATTQQWLKDHPDAALRHHAKRLLADTHGVRVRDIPDDLAEAKALQIEILRFARDGTAPCDSGRQPEAEDAKRLSGEAMPERPNEDSASPTLPPAILVEMERCE